jgi:hypothetical protein
MSMRGKHTPETIEKMRRAHAKPLAGHHKSAISKGMKRYHEETRQLRQLIQRVDLQKIMANSAD